MIKTTNDRKLCRWNIPLTNKLAFNAAEYEISLRITFTTKRVFVYVDFNDKRGNILNKYLLFSYLYL